MPKKTKQKIDKGSPRYVPPPSSLRIIPNSIINTKTEQVTIPKYAGSRYYQIDGKSYPSVTSILSIVDKSAPLMAWAVREERNAFKEAVATVLHTWNGKDKSPDAVMEAVEYAIKQVKASADANKKALEIGSQAHAMIEWDIRKRLGQWVGDEPDISPEADQAYLAFKEWEESVKMVPIRAEMTLHSKKYGYAGTCDLYAEVSGKKSIVDFKTGKAIYQESFLQVLAYRQAAKEMGMQSDCGIILRLPKAGGDAAFEAKEVPEWDGALEDFLACKRVWEWKNRK